MYFHKEDVWLSVGDTGTWQNSIILSSMHEKAKVNTYEQWKIKKLWKSVTDVRKGKTKERNFPS